MLSADAEEALVNHPWPGNVRELENVIERAVVMSGQETLTPEAFAFDDEPSQADLHSATREHAQEREIASAPAETPQAADAGATASAPTSEEDTLQATLDRAATERIRAALAATDGNRNDAATALGVDRTTLYRLMKRLGL